MTQQTFLREIVEIEVASSCANETVVHIISIGALETNCRQTTRKAIVRVFRYPDSFEKHRLNFIEVPVRELEDRID